MDRYREKCVTANGRTGFIGHLFDKVGGPKFRFDISAKKKHHDIMTKDNCGWNLTKIYTLFGTKCWPKYQKLKNYICFTIFYIRRYCLKIFLKM